VVPDRDVTAEILIETAVGGAAGRPGGVCWYLLGSTDITGGSGADRPTDGHDG